MIYYSIFSVFIYSPFSLPSTAFTSYEFLAYTNQSETGWLNGKIMADIIATRFNIFSWGNRSANMLKSW